MKTLLTIISFSFCSLILSQTVKSKPLKLKYETPEGWTAEEFGGKLNWDESGNTLCKCSGVEFTKPHKKGKMHVVVYPATPSGLDSVKRDFVGNLRFMNVEKYERTTNKNFTFEKRRSNFSDSKAGAKSWEVIRFKAKVDDHYYLIYAWQESMDLLNSTSEKELNEMVNAIEPMK